MNDTDRVVDRTPWRIAVAQSLAICGVAAAVAVAVNWTELRTGNFVPLESSLARVGIEVSSLLKEYGRGRAVVIDTRSRADYEHGHIAGAIHFDLAQFPRQMNQLSRWLPRQQHLVVVGVDHPLQRFSYQKMWHSLGYSQVSFLDGTIEQWSNADGPVVSGWDMGPLLEAGR